MARKIADNAKDFHANEAVPCCHEECKFTAMCKVKTKTGWAHVCAKHYDYHFTVEAHVALDKWGMARLPDESNAEHVTRMRQFVRKGFKRIADRELVTPEQEAA